MTTEKKKPRKCSPAKQGSKPRQERTRVPETGPRRAAKEKPKVNITAASCEPGPMRAGQLRPGGRHPREKWPNRRHKVGPNEEECGLCRGVRTAESISERYIEDKDMGRP